MGFWFNMAEQKDVCSSPPVRAPKSQLAVEQPSTEGHWNPPSKDTTHPKTKKLRWYRNHCRGAIMIKSNPIPIGWWLTNWRTIPMKFSHCCEGSEPHIRLPSLSIQKRDWESPGNLTLKASRIWWQDFHRPGRNTDSTLQGHKQKLVCTKTQQKGAVPPLDNEPDLPANAGGSPVEVWVSSGCHRDEGTDGRSPGRCPLVKVLLEITINPRIEPVASRAGLPQANRWEGAQPLPLAGNWIKALLNTALPTRARSSFPHSQSFPSGNLHLSL